MKRLLAAVILGLAVAACGAPVRPVPGASVSPSTSPASTPTPTATPATTQLTFTGAVSGSVRGAAASGGCGPGAGGAGGADLRFQLNGRAYAFSIELLTYHGPGTYPLPPDRASLHTTSMGPGSQFFGSQTGRVTVAAGGTSGTVDADLSGEAGTVHVAGAWSCAG